MKIFLINGPASSGKDTLANWAVENIPGFKKEKMAAPLKAALKAFYGLSDEEFEKIDNDPILKNQKLDRFLGYSWREVLISFSEDWVKPKHGKPTFGKLLGNRIESHLENQLKFDIMDPIEHNFMVSDCGFYDEVVPLVDKFGKSQVELIRLVRDGFDYTGDSRSYIDVMALGVNAYTLYNDDIESFKNDAKHLITRIIQNK